MVFKFIFAVCGMNCGTEGIRKSTGFEKGSPLFQKKNFISNILLPWLLREIFLKRAHDVYICSFSSHSFTQYFSVSHGNEVGEQHTISVLK